MARAEDRSAGGAATLTPSDRARLDGARLLARLLDDSVPIPGTSHRIGIDPLLGLVPGVGDALGAVLSTWILLVASRLGAPPAVIGRMALHVAIDAIVGSVPLAGDLFDAGWKANVRNVRLLEAWLERPDRSRRSSAALVAAIALAAVVAVAAVAFGAFSLVTWSARRVAG